MQRELIVAGRHVSFDLHRPPEDDPTRRDATIEPAIVLLHGLSSNRHSYDRVVAHLLGRAGRRVVNVDLRGHGRSAHTAPDRYRAADYASDVAALLDALGDDPGAPIAPAVIVGHSLGGVVAAALAVARPDLVRALFLEDPPLFEGDEAVRNASPVAAFFPRFVAAVRRLQASAAPTADYEALIAPTTAADDVAAHAEGLRTWDPATMEAAVQGLVWQDVDPEAALPCPLTILQADPACGGVFKPQDGPRVLAANPQARIVPMAGAGHSVHGAPTLAAYLAELDRFLAALTG